MKEQLRQAIKTALQQCYDNGSLSSGAIPDEIQLEVPKNPDHGDFASNLAMTMAKAERKAPRQIAEALAVWPGASSWSLPPPALILSGISTKPESENIYC